MECIFTTKAKQVVCKECVLNKEEGCRERALSYHESFNCNECQHYKEFYIPAGGYNYVVDAECSAGQNVEVCGDICHLFKDAP